ncbi:MAG: DUF1189 family protein [Tenericutes bacterium]|nr:DUF1189 family protein [Mycoplasmatota bacterium]
MFKRLATSLSRPPQAVFFMKDSWGKVLLYLFFLPLLLVLPVILYASIDSSMKLSRYEHMVKAIEENFVVDDTFIVDGILSYGEPVSTRFEHFTLYIGEQVQERATINFIFEEQHLVMYMSNVEFNRMTYQQIELENHDFSDDSPVNIRNLASSIKLFYEAQPEILYTDILLTYLFGLFDYLFYALLMAFMMLLFIPRIQLPFKFRFKLSVYLTTIWIFFQLVTSLFGIQEINSLGIIVLYIYHIWAFRSMKMISKGVIL